MSKKLNSNKLKNKSLKDLVYSFLDYMEIQKGSSPLTIRNYRHYLTRFVDWGKDRNMVSSPEEIDQEALHHYRLYLSRIKTGRGDYLSKKTHGYHMIAIRSFLKWLNKHDFEIMPASNIDLPKVDDRKITFLNGEQIDRLLSAPSMSKIHGKRDKAILEVLFSTGLRVSELVNLDRDQVDLQRREFGVRGKGGKVRVVFLSSRASDWVDVYLKARKDHFKPLFIRHSGPVDPTMDDEDMRLTSRSVQRAVKKYGKKVSIPFDVTPHIIRHSFATDLLQAGADLRSVQEMLGHKNVATTQIYTHVTDKQLKEIHGKYHSHEGQNNSLSSSGVDSLD